MKHLHFEPETDGFYGAYWESKSRPTPHSCKYSVYLYEHGTHFVFPESVLKKALPFGADTLVNMSFSSAKKSLQKAKLCVLTLIKYIHRNT